MTRWLAVTVLLAGSAVALAGASVLPLEMAEAYLTENGPIEFATAFLWFALALVLVALSLAGRRALLFPGFVAALAGARELDAQTAFTSEAVTNLRYWTRDDALVSEKILVAVFLVAIAAVFLIGIRQHWRAFAKSLASGEGYAWSVATVLLAAPTLMLVDGAGRYYKDLTGRVLDPATHILTVAVEETGEMMLPVIGFIALGQYLEGTQAGWRPSSGGTEQATDNIADRYTDGA